MCLVSMASILNKFGDDVDIDDTLTSEGLESELSLADDTDEFADSFSGTLSFSDDSGKRQLAFSAQVDDEGAEMPFTVGDGPTQKTKTRISFEIVNANIVQEGRKKYVNYSILVIAPGLVDSSRAMVERRYSDFFSLHNILKKKYPHYMHDISFPKKMVTGNFRPETIARRSRAFEQYLYHVYYIDQLRLSPELTAFFYDNDLKTAYTMICQRDYSGALPLLQTAVHLQQKLLGEHHPAVSETLCAIVAVLAALEQEKQAQNVAEAALQVIGDRSSKYLAPLLQLSIRLCWKLGKDKKDLEAKLQQLRDQGVDIDGVPSLIDVVCKR